MSSQTATYPSTISANPLQSKNNEKKEVVQNTDSTIKGRRYKPNKPEGQTITINHRLQLERQNQMNSSLRLHLE